MVELKDRQQEEVQGRHLVPGVAGTYIRIFQSSQLEGSHVGDLLCSLAMTRRPSTAH